MKQYKRLLLSMLYFFTVIVSSAQTRLPAIFSDNMVLQQQQMVTFWGSDTSGKKISVRGSWGKSANTTSDANGFWKIKLQTPIAGGPYNILVKGSKEITLKNVLIGEVWFCSGQSNMEMPVKGYTNQPVTGSNETILNSANDKIRFLNTARTVSITPLYDVKGEWKPASPATTVKFRGGKYSAFEAGTRVPFIVCWKGKVTPGKVSDALFSQVDLYASLAKLLNTTPENGMAPDSRDHLQTLLNKKGVSRDHLIEQSLNSTLSIIKGNWKYIEPSNGPVINKNTNTELGNSKSPQLYNLKTDPVENKNVAEQYPEITRELKDLLEKMKKNN